jgi:hypothetical protein
MAGRNAAVNLTGMLRDATGSIRRGLTVDGRSAGDAFADSFHNAMTPDLKMDDPASMRKFADWARRAGKEETAVQYEEKAMQVEREQGMMRRMDGYSQATAQGTAAAQQGDPNAVAQQAGRLRTMAKEAATPQERMMYEQQAQQLQGAVPQATQIQKAKQASAIQQIEQVMDREDVDPQAKAALKERYDMMMADPTVAQMVTDQKFSAWERQRQERDMRAGQWMQQNNERLTEAVLSGDADRVETIIGEAGEFSAEATAVVDRLQTGREVMRKLRTERVERTRTLNVDNKEKFVANLPEEFQPAAKAMLEQMKQHEDQYFSNGTWTEGSLARAKALEGQYETLMRSSMSNQASAAYGARLSEERTVKGQIRRTELAREIPPSADEIRSVARMITKDADGEPTEEDFKTARSTLIQQRNQMVDAQLRILRGEEVEPAGEEMKDDGGFTVKAPDGRIVTRAMVQEAVAKKDSATVRQSLRKSGLSDEQITVLMNDDATVEQLMNPRPSPEAVYIERIRGNISPMGTYSDAILGRNQ